MKKFLISPPFGTFFSHPACTSILGTFTLYPRGSLFTKTYRALATIRPIQGGWVNRMGLQNTGIASVRVFIPEHIYSIAALEESDWEGFYETIPPHASLEINMSCPNVAERAPMGDEWVRRFLVKYPLVIFKLSPTPTALSEVERLAELGASYFHLFNTLPTERGGESGIRLRVVSLRHISEVRNRIPHVHIVGGGGVYSIDDARAYSTAGATHLSFASIFFNPLRAKKVIAECAENVTFSEV